MAATSAVCQTTSLNEALDLARTHRPAIRAAKLSVDQARQTKNALGSYPATIFGVGQSTRKDLGATDQDLFITQPIDIFGRTSANRKVGQVGIKIAEANYEGTLLAVQTEVMRHYFQAATAAKLASVSDELLKLAESLQKATVRRFEEGKVPEVQVTRATIELDRARQAANLRRSQHQSALKRLEGAVGAPVQVDTEASLPKPTNQDIEGRPDLRLLAAQAEQAQAESNVARRSRFPELEVTALRSPWRDRPTNFGARIQLTFPLYDHGRSRSESSAAQKQAESSQAQLEDARQKAMAELAAIEEEITSAQQNLTSYAEIQVAARSLVEKTQRGYTEGFGTFIEVLEATRALREIEQELAEARLNLNLAEAARYEAAGILLEANK